MESLLRAHSTVRMLSPFRVRRGASLRVELFGFRVSSPGVIVILHGLSSQEGERFGSASVGEGFCR